MKKQFLLAVILLLISACAARAPGYNNFDSQFNASRDAWISKVNKDGQQVSVLMDGIGSDIIFFNKNCSDPVWNNAENKANELLGLARYRQSLAEDNTTIFNQDRQEGNLKLLSSLNDAALGSLFAIADSAAELNCNIIAERNYKAVVKTFIGSRFVAHRERARVGLDDLRAKRK
jgi:hypothetical protein